MDFPVNDQKVLFYHHHFSGNFKACIMIELQIKITVLIFLLHAKQEGMLLPLNETIKSNYVCTYQTLVMRISGARLST